MVVNFIYHKLIRGGIVNENRRLALLLAGRPGLELRAAVLQPLNSTAGSLRISFVQLAAQVVVLHDTVIGATSARRTLEVRPLLTCFRLSLASFCIVASWRCAIEI